MTKVNVTLEASYGCDCMGCGYGSEESIEIEVNDIELEALRKIGADEVSCEEVVRTIDEGDTALQSLHENIEEKFYYMVEDYWLFEAYNECLEECLEGHIESDIEEGEFEPTSFEDFADGVRNNNIDFDGLQFGYFDDIEDECEEDEDLEYYYDKYILNEYYDWVCTHDHAFIAERVGLDLDACRDDEVNYTLHLIK